MNPVIFNFVYTLGGDVLFFFEEGMYGGGFNTFLDTHMFLMG